MAMATRGDRFLFAGRQQHVHFAGRRGRADLVGQRDQLVGLVAASTHDHHDLIVATLGGDGPRGRGPNLCGVRDARSAEFLNDQGHGGELLPQESGLKSRENRLSKNSSRKNNRCVAQRKSAGQSKKGERPVSAGRFLNRCQNRLAHTSRSPG